MLRKQITASPLVVILNKISHTHSNSILSIDTSLQGGV